MSDEFNVSGQYKPCDECQAGIPIDGFPADWSLTISRGRTAHDGPMLPVTITPHRPDCRRGTTLARLKEPNER